MRINKSSTLKAPRWSFIVVLTPIIIISGILAPAAVSLAAVTEGYITFSFGLAVTSEPAGEKPESKLWYTDGLWWGSLFNDSDEAYHIYRFNPGTQSWSDTGVPIDERNNSKADVLWDQATQKLYVASHIFTRNATSSGVSSSNWGRLYRYSYNAGSDTYTLDTGYPVNITLGVSEALTIAKDSTGRLWVTYVEDAEVMVNHSLADDATWATPYVLPVSNAQVLSDDISSIIAFQGNKIGVVWSNQLIAGTGMFMAVHVDGDADNQWQLETIVMGGDMADDHINLKTDSSGRLFVAAKTSLSGSDPLIVLHVRGAGGGWTMYTVTTHSERQTRPIVMIHVNENKVYVFAKSDTEGNILFKSSDIDNISFAPGMGTVFIEDTTSPNLNNPSSTKQNVTTAMGMLVIADNEVNHFYYHNDALEGVIDPPPTTLLASATCIGDDLEITISAGDAPFDIVASSAPPGSGTFDDVSAGVYVSNGPGTWTNVSVIEQGGDFETAVLGDFTCSTSTDTPVPPTDTLVPPTDTPVPPTDTPAPPTDTPAPPTDTPVPPTDTPASNVVLVASAQCVGPDLEITISAGDANFNIFATTAPPGNGPYSNVPLGTYTSTGPGTWTGVRVVELSGDNEVKILGDFTCTVVTDTPVPPTDTPVPISLAVSAACVNENLAVTISDGDGPFNITASAGINTPVNGVNTGTTTINGPEKWDNLTVTETSGDMQSVNLGQFRCRSDERPVPLSPAHRSRTTNPFPTFSWTSITNANNYRVFVFDDADPATRTVDIRQNSGGPTSMMLTIPLPDGRLFWRARGRQNRIWSLWSIRFTLFKDPAPPLTMNTPIPTIDLNPRAGDGSAPTPVPTVGPAPTFPAPPNSR